LASVIAKGVFLVDFSCLIIVFFACSCQSVAYLVH
jgi:hypothetical protein